MAVGCTMAASALAQTDSTSTSAHVIDNVTVTGHRFPAGIISSAPVQSLTKEQMLDMGVNDIGEAMKHFAGVQVKDY